MTTTLKLYNADCLEQMKSIPDKSIDLILCDLPYGSISSSWDIKLDLGVFWEQVKRIRRSERSACIHFCSTKFGVDLINSNPKEYRYDLVWNKKRGVSFLLANRKPMTSHEMIYVFAIGGANYNRIDDVGEPYLNARRKGKTQNYCGIIKPVCSINTGTRCPLSVIDKANIIKGSRHPTTKPVDLYKWLIERYSNEGDTILDPTFGSCNSGIASRELNRNYIGIELNKEFFDKANHALNPTII